MRHLSRALAGVLALGVSMTLAPTVLTSGALPAAGGSVAARADRPNIVLITTDDMRADDLRVMPFTRTVLARRGVTFTDAVSPYPLCCPARAEIVTGQYSHNNGVRGNAWPNGGYWALTRRHNTLPVWLRERGYRTGFVGKYLNEYGNKPTARALAGRPRYEVPPGWSHWYASVHRTYDYNGVVLNVDTPTTRPHRVHSSAYQTTHFAGITEGLISTFHRTGKPFFIWMSHLAPHTASVGGAWVPPIAAPGDLGAFTGAGLPDRRDYRRALNEDTPDKRGPMLGRPKQDLGALRTLHRRRLESLRSVDRAVRRVVRRLRATRELHRTVIIFTSDNGFALGEHRHVGKDMPYEPSLRIPMIVSAPGVKQRYRPGAGPNALVRVPHTVTTLDVPATVVAASGARPRRALDGLNLLRPRHNPDHAGGDRLVLIESGAAGPRRTATSKFVGVRSNRWTWFGWHARPVAAGLRFGGRELYDRRTTPSQVTNVVGVDRFAAVGARLQQLAQRMHTCRGKGCVRGLG